MALSFVLGNILGRLFTSYALVWLLCWLSVRCNWRLAFKRSTRWYSVLAVLVLTLLGIGVAWLRGGGVR